MNEIIHLQNFRSVQFSKKRWLSHYNALWCGVDQENSIGHVNEALMDKGMERLDHGTNIVEEPKLVDYVKEHRIGFTCCPVSNSFVVVMYLKPIDKTNY